MEQWIQELTTTINFALKNCEYSFLYGSVLAQWFDMEKDKKGEAAAEEDFEMLDNMDVDTKDSSLSLKETTILGNECWVF